MAVDWGVREFRAHFFDTKAIEKSADAAMRKTQSELGARVRTRIKSSLRYGRGISSPGQPPKVHQSNRFTRNRRDRKTREVKRQPASPLRELVFFGYDPRTKSTVVGPAKFGATGAPPRLEKGGPGTFRDPKTGATKSGYWRPRPFVKPAGDAESQKSRSVLRNSVR